MMSAVAYGIVCSGVRCKLYVKKRQRPKEAMQ